MREPMNRGQNRLLVLRLLVGGVVLVLGARLWQFQMVEGEQYRLLADRNRLRQVEVAGPRGVIYDRDGKILARNRPTFNVAIVPADLPRNSRGEPDEAAEAAVLDRLLNILQWSAPTATSTPPSRPTAVPGNAATGPLEARAPSVMPRQAVEEAIKAGRAGGAYRPIVVASRIAEATAFRIAEDAVNLPGVELVLEPVRDYPSGPITSQIIGYMGHIPEDAVETYRARGYAANEQVGLTGLEATLESELRGKPGRQMIEVDVNGRKVRTVGVPDPAEPGHNIVLTLDLELQKAATQALQEALDNSRGFAKATQGAVVALNPQNGAVLALVSLPTYDNNLFATGIAPDAWQALTSDPNLPLFNQAISGRYPPGSTFKIIVASGGLQDGVISTRTLLGDGFDGSNDGVIWVPNQYAPWDRSKDQPFYSWIHKLGRGHGLVNVREAIAVSDDIFFYQLGGGYLDIFRNGMGPEAIGYYAREFGLGQPTGIELPGEDAGHVPDPRWKRLQFAENWLTGDTYNMSIGQGFVLATPLQMANATAAVANRGYLYQPQLVDHITDAEGKTIRPFQPKLIREVAVNPAHLDTVREGMYGAVNWPQGTAPLARLPGVTVAGKTGTAEYFRDANKDGKADRDEKGNLPTHAWFTCFAPYVNPEIVVTVFLANGGEGSTAAVPVARRVLEAYFRLSQPQGATRGAP